MVARPTICCRLVKRTSTRWIGSPTRSDLGQIAGPPGRLERGGGQTPRAGALTGVAQVTAPARSEALPGSEEVEAADLEAHADFPDAVQRGAMPLVLGAELIVLRHIRLRARNRSAPVASGYRHRMEDDVIGARRADAARVPIPRQRIRRARLPPVAEALGEGVLPAVVVRAAVHDFRQDGAPLRERLARLVRERIVGACRRIVGEVRVEPALFLAAAGEHEVRLERHHAPNCRCTPIDAMWLYDVSCAPNGISIVTDRWKHGAAPVKPLACHAAKFAACAGE